MKRGSGPIHQGFKELMNAMEQNDLLQIHTKHFQLFKMIQLLNPEFQHNQQSDAHEALMYLINALHQESKIKISSQAQQSLQQDVVSKQILHDFDSCVSLILQVCLSCVIKVNSDHKSTCETYTCLFLEPKPDSITQGLSIQPTLDSMKFGHLPKCLFISLISIGSCQFNLYNDIFIQGYKYSLQGVIYFLPSLSHYVTIVRHMEPLPDGTFDWFLIDDTKITKLHQSQIDMSVPGHPCVFSYTVQALN